MRVRLSLAALPKGVYAALVVIVAGVLAVNAAALSVLDLFSPAMPECNDDWVEENLVEWFVDEDATDLFKLLADSGLGKAAIDLLRKQEFAVVGARTITRQADVHSATCEAWIHGKKLAPGPSLQEDSQELASVSYEVYLTDDGDPYVKLLEMKLVDFDG